MEKDKRWDDVDPDIIGAQIEKMIDELFVSKEEAAKSKDKSSSTKVSQEEEKPLPKEEKEVYSERLFAQEDLTPVEEPPKPPLDIETKSEDEAKANEILKKIEPPLEEAKEERGKEIIEEKDKDVKVEFDFDEISFEEDVTPAIEPEKEPETEKITEPPIEEERQEEVPLTGSEELTTLESLTEEKEKEEVEQQQEQESLISSSQIEEVRAKPLTPPIETKKEETDLYTRLHQKLKESLLSLDWEISSENIDKFLESLNDIRNHFSDDKFVNKITLIMSNVLNYIKKAKQLVSPLSMQILHTGVNCIEHTILTSKPKVDQKEFFSKIFNQYKLLKFEIDQIKEKRRRAKEKALVSEYPTPMELIQYIKETVDSSVKSALRSTIKEEMDKLREEVLSLVNKERKDTETKEEKEEIEEKSVFTLEKQKEPSVDVSLQEERNVEEPDAFSFLEEEAKGKEQKETDETDTLEVETKGIDIEEIALPFDMATSEEAPKAEPEGTTENVAFKSILSDIEPSGTVTVTPEPFISEELPTEGTSEEEVLTVTIGERKYHIPKALVANVYSLSRRKARKFKETEKVKFKDLVSAFGSVSKGIKGPLLAKKAKELKNMEISIIDIKNILGIDSETEGKKLVVVSDGKTAFGFFADEVRWGKAYVPGEVIETILERPEESPIIFQTSTSEYSFLNVAKFL